MPACGREPHAELFARIGSIPVHPGGPSGQFAEQPNRALFTLYIRVKTLFGHCSPLCVACFRVQLFFKLCKKKLDIYCSKLQCKLLNKSILTDLYICRYVMGQFVYFYSKMYSISQAGKTAYSAVGWSRKGYCS